MATDKKKKEVQVRDLKPSKDAKGGAARAAGSTNRAATNRSATNRSATNRSSTAGRTSL